MKGNSRRGSVFVEASLIYPVIIVITVLLIAIAMYFYGMAARLSDMNRSARRAAGEESGTVYYAEETGLGLPSFETRTEQSLLSKSIVIDSQSRFQNRLLFALDGTHNSHVEAAVLCEADLIRLKQTAGDVFEAIRE